MYNNVGSFIGYLDVKFSPKMQYFLRYCTGGYKDLPVQPPVEVDKSWKITKAKNSLIITCNDVEVLNYQFADSSDSDCGKKWGGDVVEEILFVGGQGTGSDTASDFYKAGNY